MATLSFPVNPELSAIAIGYSNPAYTLIADQCLPRVVKTGILFNYTKYNSADAYTVPTTLVGRKSDPTMVDFGGVLVPGQCVDYGLDDLVPVEEIDAWEAMPRPPTGGPVNPMKRSTAMLSGLIQLDREVRVAGIVFNTANYVAANTQTLAGTSQWSDYVNSNPLSALMTALDVPVVRPNVAIFGQQTWTAVRQHPKVVQACFGTAQTAGVVTRQRFAEVLEVGQILVGAGFVNTARKGQAPTYARVWGKHCSLIYADADMADAMQPTWGFTAQFGTRIAGELPEPRNGLRGGIRVRVGESVAEVVSAPDTGYFFQNAVA